MARGKKATRDREGPDPPESVPSNVLASRIGIRQSLTPEGFLLCEEVPIARTGWMIYGPDETPIEIDEKLGYAEVYRDAEDLFAAEAIQSLTGKPIVDEHPAEDVTPASWKDLAKGFVINVRAGTGFDDDCLLGDLMITDQQAIASVRGGKREVSAGYSADYQQTGPGQGLQTNIIFNHIALVERGRCGPRCAIGDHQLPLKGKHDMATKTTGVLAPKRRAVLATQVRDALAELEEMDKKDKGEGTEDDVESGNGSTTEENHTHIHIHQAGAASAPDDKAKDEEPAPEEKPAASAADPNEARFAQIEQSLADLATQVKALADAVGSGGGESEESEDTADEFPPKKADKKDDDEEKDDKKEAKTKDGKKTATLDSAALETGYKETTALAEILVPGFRMPTFDASAKRSATIDSMCGSRRLALTACWATADGRTLLETVHGATPDLPKMDCKDVAALFRTAAGAKKLINNRSTGDGKLSSVQQPGKGAISRPETIADLNKTYREFYAAKNPTAKH